MDEISKGCARLKLLFPTSTPPASPQLSDSAIFGPLDDPLFSKESADSPEAGLEQMEVDFLGGVGLGPEPWNPSSAVPHPSIYGNQASSAPAATVNVSYIPFYCNVFLTENP